jgi:hypothetical protein
MESSVISLLDDEEDEDLKLAISLSLQKDTVPELNPLRFNKLSNSSTSNTISFSELLGKVKIFSGNVTYIRISKMHYLLHIQWTWNGY